MENQEGIKRRIEVATFCRRLFFSVQSRFAELGVHAVISGYIGKTRLIQPTRKYAMETPGHAGLIEISFDPEKSDLRTFGIFFA
jgi:peptide methionine sulfoxide reductase MsrA